MIVNQGTHSARMIKRAQILLHSDAGRKPQEIAEWLNVCPSTVYNIRERYLNEGVTVRSTRNPVLASRQARHATTSCDYRIGV